MWIGAMVHGLSVKVVFLCLFSKCGFRNASPETRGHAFAYHNLFVYHDYQSENIIQLQSAGIRTLFKIRLVCYNNSCNGIIIYI